MNATERSRADVIRELLDKGMVRIIVDTTRHDVIVPQALKADPMLHLNLSYRFEGHNMRFGQSGLCVTLSFADSAFRCELPWACILAAGIVPREEAKTETRKRNHLRAVQ